MEPTPAHDVACHVHRPPRQTAYNGTDIRTLIPNIRTLIPNIRTLITPADNAQTAGEQPTRRAHDHDMSATGDPWRAQPAANAARCKRMRARCVAGGRIAGRRLRRRQCELESPDDPKPVE
jgi:hypothetical protein